MSVNAGQRWEREKKTETKMSITRLKWCFMDPPEKPLLQFIGETKCTICCESFRKKYKTKNIDLANASCCFYVENRPALKQLWAFIFLKLPLWSGSSQHNALISLENRKPTKGPAHKPTCRPATFPDNVWSSFTFSRDISQGTTGAGKRSLCTGSSKAF